MTLNRKQSLFVDEYLRDMNATQAAMRAGYSKRSAYSIGSENLRKPEIAAEIQRRLDEKKMTADEDLVRLSEMARADISEFIKEGGAINWEVVRKKGYLVKKIRHNAFKNSEIELHDSLHALELIGKAHRLFVERFETDNKLNVIGLEALLDKIYGDGSNKSGS